MTQPEIEKLAREWARAHGLDEALVCAICEQESSWNPWAMRYEPGFYTHYIVPLTSSGKVGTATEATARATSWGVMQVMGQVAREHGYGGKWLNEMCDPDIGLSIGCLVLKRLLHQAAGDLRTALLRWNGGGRPDYADEVLQKMQKYQGEKDA